MGFFSQQIVINDKIVVKLFIHSSGSSGWVRGGAEKHEIYVTAFGGHLFYDLFSQGWGGAWPPRPPGSATDPMLF